jgi:MFS transporter, PAT family, beta-lactamase induction signal transducer AmpG
LGAAVFTFGYRFAMLISGGLALIIADHWGWRVLYQIMACLIAVSMITTYFSPTENATILPKSFLKVVKESYKNLIQHDKIILILLFVLLYKMGDALAISLMSPFLLKGLGFTLTEIGIGYKTAGLIATLLGAFLAGIFLIRMRLFQALLFFGLLQAFSNLFFVLLVYVDKNFTLMASAIFIESFCSGMSTAAFVAFIMSLCDKRYSALQYALLSAIFSLARVIAGPIASNIVASYGWAYLYWFSFALCFPSLFILILLRHEVRMNNAEATV